ncbi:hypothetical protein AWZ03_006878 [Drosophila navojoa]|uniref:Uncharacterized protein n=1 Tax=Drosophila navojoa TaxID=7232 RepID=A0A484BD98_DRONA|nr:protein FAM184A [Drosophila navojoa]TDG46698.1 hypothetical protein AWZ03_006878 [Drosophila navojoa]
MDIVDICSEDKSPKFPYSKHSIATNVNNSWSTVNNQGLASTSSLMMEQQSAEWKSTQDMIRLARMRVVTSVMLHAWRQRRADVRKLKQAVERLQKNSIFSKNELHVSKTLMRVEQKRCRELQVELKKSTISMNQARKSCEMLNTSLINLQADKDQLEKELISCKQEQSELKKIAVKCNEDLRNSLYEQLNLKKQLTEEESNVQQLKEEKERLLKEVSEMEKEHRNVKESFVLQLDKKSEELASMRSTVEQLEQKLKHSQTKRNELKQYLKNINSIEQADPWPRPDVELPIKPIVVSTPQSRALTVPNRRYAELLSTVQCYTYGALFWIWLTLLPRKSLRYGCMPTKR